MADTTPGTIASNPGPVAVAATAFVANLSALLGLVEHWDAGVTTAVTVTATSAVALVASVLAGRKSTANVVLAQLAASRAVELADPALLKVPEGTLVVPTGQNTATPDGVPHGPPPQP